MSTPAITPDEARVANFLVVAFAILYVLTSLFFVASVWHVRSVSADHKAQLNRVIELLEKKP